MTIRGLEIEERNVIEVRPVGADDRKALHHGIKRRFEDIVSVSGAFGITAAVIVDNSEVYRAGLIQLLTKSGLEVVAACANLAELGPNTLGGRRCLLIGLDHAGDIGVLRAIARLHEEHRDLRILLLAHDFDPILLRDAIRAGLNGCLLKSEITSGLLLRTMELVVLGGTIFSEGLPERLLAEPLVRTADASGVSENSEADFKRSQAAPARNGIGIRTASGPLLSSRECTMLQHLMQGAPNKQIARDLGIADATVKIHIKSLLRKIQVRNRTQAAIWGTINMSSIGVMPNNQDRSHARSPGWVQRN